MILKIKSVERLNQTKYLMFLWPAPTKALLNLFLWPVSAALLVLK